MLVNAWFTCKIMEAVCARLPGPFRPLGPRPQAWAPAPGPRGPRACALGLGSGPWALAPWPPGPKSGPQTLSPGPAALSPRLGPALFRTIWRYSSALFCLISFFRTIRSRTGVKTAQCQHYFALFNAVKRYISAHKASMILHLRW